MTEASTKSQPTAQVMRELVARAQQSDREALEELYLLHFDRIYSYLHLAVGNKHDAEDLTTQTFLKMLESISRYRIGKAPFSAWLFRIAHNLAMDHFRAGKRVQPSEELPEREGAVEDSAEDHAMRDIGRASMLQLLGAQGHARDDSCRGRSGSRAAAAREPPAGRRAPRRARRLLRHPRAGRRSRDAPARAAPRRHRPRRAPPRPGPQAGEVGRVGPE